MMNYQRDGFMRLKSNFEGSPNYYPNSFLGPKPDPTVRWPSLAVFGAVARHPYSHPNDNFVQPRALYRKVMTNVDRDHLVGNIVDHLGKAKKKIQLRQTALFYRVDAEYGKRVAEGLALDIEKVKNLTEK